MLLQRLSEVEQKLDSLGGKHVASVKHSAGRMEEPQLEKISRAQGPHEPVTIATPNHALSQQSLIWDDRSAFAGEASVRYSLEHMEDRLERMGVDRPIHPSSPPQHAMTPPLRPTTPAQVSSIRGTRWGDEGTLRQLLYSYGVTIDRNEWEACLTLYFVDVHPLYPFMHPPSVWDEFSRLWGIHMVNRSAALPEKDKLAPIFLCLAIGRCQTAVRTGSNGRHSAGWSLYCVANDLTGDILNLCGTSSSPILQLQTLCLMAVYLFRLDANERAQNVLALAVSRAHSFGIHRKLILEKMPLSESEISTRIWWCVYVLDRRLCIETGRPFLILDLNADAGLPSDVSDTWLSSQRSNNDTTSDRSDTVIDVELRDSDISPVSYLKAMIEYSRIIGKVWELGWATPVVKQPLNSFIREYVEVSLARWKKKLPQELVYRAGSEQHSQGRGVTRTVIQQRFLLHIRHYYLLLMIRKPVLQPLPDDLECNLTCVRHAHTIIQAFVEAPSSWSILKFPYLPYLLGSTMASLSILITDPTFRVNYANATIKAAQTLKRACYESWVSGKTARTIARLYTIVCSTLLSHQSSVPGEQDSTLQETDASTQPSVSQHDTHIQQWLPSAAAGMPRAGGHPSQPPFQEFGSLVQVSTASSNLRALRESSVQNDRQQRYPAVGRQNFVPAPAPGFAELNMGEFDFEDWIDGGRVISAGEPATLLLWDTGTEAWLDRLVSTTSSSHP